MSIGTHENNAIHSSASCDVDQHLAWGAGFQPKSLHFKVSLVQLKVSRKSLPFK